MLEVCIHRLQDGGAFSCGKGIQRRLKIELPRGGQHGSAGHDKQYQFPGARPRAPWALYALAGCQGGGSGGSSLMSNNGMYMLLVQKFWIRQVLIYLKLRATC